MPVFADASERLTYVPPDPAGLEEPPPPQDPTLLGEALAYWDARLYVPGEPKLRNYGTGGWPMDLTIVGPTFDAGTEMFAFGGSPQMMWCPHSASLDWTASSSMTAVVAVASTGVDSGRYMAKRTNSSAGWVITENGASTSSAGTYSGGAWTVDYFVPNLTLDDTLVVLAGGFDIATSQLTSWHNGAASGSPATIANLNCANTTGLSIGCENPLAGGGDFASFRFRGAAVFNRLLSAGEHAQVVTEFGA